jgi:hypothetical protein
MAMAFGDFLPAADSDNDVDVSDHAAMDKRKKPASASAGGDWSASFSR